MKRRVLSLITTLALCLNLCPMWVLAAGGDDGLCPHHPAHTDVCGYVLPASEQACTHVHDESCYRSEVSCVHEHTDGCYPEANLETAEPAACAHMCTSDSGCVTQMLDCRHEHDAECGYVPGNSGEPCQYVCRVCPINELLDRLPRRVTEANSQQVQDQLDEIYGLYDGLTSEEQQLVDLSPCYALMEQMDELDSAVLEEGSIDGNVVFEEDDIRRGVWVISRYTSVDTNGFTLYAAPGKSAIQIVAGGELDFTGRVDYKEADSEGETGESGIEVLSGGILRITGEDTDIRGGMYGLKISSGASVELSGGRYSGDFGAISTDNTDNYAGFLAEGCSYFDAGGNPILPKDVGTLETVVVGKCGHPNKQNVEAVAGKTSHTFECLNCEMTAEENCTFTFPENGSAGVEEGTCVCGHTITVTVDEDSLSSLDFTDNTVKPAQGIVAVTLDDGTILSDTAYTVSYSTHAEAGNPDYTVTVIVEGVDFNGTFENDYVVTKTDKPDLEWDDIAPVSVDYDGEPVEAGELPGVVIHVQSSEDLSGYLEYSYKAAGDSTYTKGLPTNAGTYDVVATLPENPGNPGGQAVSSAPITLNIRPIDPVETEPVPARPIFNRGEQELVTPGVLKDVAERDGLEIQFSTTGAAGSFSATIPTGTNAGTGYQVWYTVSVPAEAAGNYKLLTPTDPAEITGVEILRKPITPVIKLSQSSFPYDGAKKEPVITVMDDKFVIDEDQYTFVWENDNGSPDGILTAAGSYTATITGKDAADGGNYEFTAEAHVEITLATQNALKITGKPSHVYYGDVIESLEAEGGTGNGRVTWSLEESQPGAGVPTGITINGTSGVLTVKDVGTVTVRAERTVPNYGTATDEWTFTVEPKAVTAEVKIDPKDYDGSTAIADTAIHAAVKNGDLVNPGDASAVSGLTAVYDTPNAGRNKTVTLDSSGASSAADPRKYAVSYPAATVGDINPKQVTVTVELSGEGLQTDSSANPPNYYIFDGTAKTPNVTLKDENGNTIPEEAYTVAYSNNTNVSDENSGVYAVVTVTAKPDGNYAFTSNPATARFEIRKEQAKVIAAPKPAGDPLVYNTREQGLVTAGIGSGGTMVYSLAENGTYTADIPTKKDAGTYTVYYKVQGDANHSDSAVGNVTVDIGPKQVKDPTIELLNADGTPFNSCVYDGSPQEPPKIVVRDGSTEIPGAEYTVQYLDNVNAGKASVQIKDNLNGNYTVTGSAQFDILKADIVFNPEPEPNDWTYDGQAHALLDPAGRATGGEILYALGNEFGTYTAAVPTATDAGPYVVYYKVKGDANHNDFPATRVDVTVNRAAASIDTPPNTVALTYNGQPQRMVTPGAASVGEILYSLDGGEFSAEIPTAVHAGSYTVHYKVEETGNYTGVAETAVSVTILRKTVTPEIVLDPPSHVYNGAAVQPKLAVKDGITVLAEDQYTVVWQKADGTTVSDGMLKDVGKYTVNVTSENSGNYTFQADPADAASGTTVTAGFEIFAADQGALKITGNPEHVYYGDVIKTLKAEGGTGNGTVKWSLEESQPGAGVPAGISIDGKSGELTVKNVGTVTVRAERTVPNYGTVSDTWTVTVEPKPVVAEVTVTAKDYDGKTDIASGNITAAVKTGDLVDPADAAGITLSQLTGEFEDAGAGKGKTVKLGTAAPTVTGKYAVSYPATAVGDINQRQVTVTVTLSGNDLQTETPTNPADPPVYYYIFNNSERTPDVTVTDSNNDGSYPAVLAPGDYTVTYSNNKNVSTTGNPAVVTVTAKPDGNYTFTTATAEFEIRDAGAVLTSSPQARDLEYNGQAHELVTVGTATGGTVVYSLAENDPAQPYSETIPTGTNAGEYIVYYKVQGDANHADAPGGRVTVTIRRRSFTPTITLSQDSYTYDGTAKTPGVTVYDGTVEIDGPGTAKPEYTVSYLNNVNAGTATVRISDAGGGNYIVSGLADFEIEKAPAEFDADKEPEGIQNLYYTGERQQLVTEGVTSHGTVLYSLNGGSYTSAIPTADAVGTYTINYRIQGDANHSDITSGTPLEVKIVENTVTNPTIELSQDSFQYNGEPQRPVVTVYDDQGRLIPTHEYTVTITGSKSNNMVDEDTYTVTVTTPGTSGTSNYVIAGDGTVNNTRTYEIVKAEQDAITIVRPQGPYYYGDVLDLDITGGTGLGTVKWEVTGGNAITQTGQLTIKDVGGPFTVTATRTKANYGDVSASWEFSAGKKPVTAVVTAEDRPYSKDDRSVTVHADVPASALVAGDAITISGLTGTFADGNVGTDKKVTLNKDNVTVSGNNSDKYEITWPDVTASILAKAAEVTTPPKERIDSLNYDATQEQELVTAGVAVGGTMVYSLDGANYSVNLPRAQNAGTYKVYYKVLGDRNHTDSAVGTVDVTIARQRVENADLQIELSPPSAPYDGKVHQPAVTVKDKTSNVIPDSEYSVTYVNDNGENWKDKGTYEVKIEDITGGNYEIVPATADFEITQAGQLPLEIVNKPGLVYYGDTFTLSATGGSVSGAVTWSVTAGTGVAVIDSNGLVRITGTGEAVITATKAGGGNYDDAEATYTFNALKKPVTAVVTAKDKTFDNKTDAEVTAVINGLVSGDDVTIDLEGSFDTADVGTNITVKITKKVVAGADAGKYDVTVPDTTTASILKAPADLPTVNENTLTYTGAAQELVTGGNDNTRYSDTRDGVYSTNVPQKTNAGTYTVWYMQKGDDNHSDSEPQGITVTIAPKLLNNPDITLSGNDLLEDPSATPRYSYKYDGTEKRPAVIIVDDNGAGKTVPAGEYTVSYLNNKNVSTTGNPAVVTITDNEGGNYTFATQTVNFTITAGGAQLTREPEPKNPTYNGAAQELVTGGIATGGTVVYSLDDPDGTYTADIPTGTNAGTYTVYYKVQGDDNYEGNDTIRSVSVTIRPKEIISPVITVSDTYDYTFNGTAKEPPVTVEDGGTVIDGPGTAKPEYTVQYSNNVNAGTAAVTIVNANGGNYIVNGSGTFTIDKAAIDDTKVTAPVGLSLPYNGSAQELVEAGTAEGGTMVYSLSENGEYSPAIPVGTAVDGYTVWYRVKGDENHNDSAPVSVNASITVNTVTKPTILVAPPQVTYNGKKQEPVVTVKDDNGLVINSSEYTVTYTGQATGKTDLTDVDKYGLTIADAKGNYVFTAANAVFEILPAGQTPMTITGTREKVSYGDTIQLSTTGGNGTVTWTLKAADGTEVTDGISSTGLLTVKDVGSFTVTATSSAPGYDDLPATWPFYAEKKQVTAVVTVEPKPYDGTTVIEAGKLSAAINGLVSGDTVTVTVEGSFEDPNVGTDKRVNITKVTVGGTDAGKYDVSVAGPTTGSIIRADITDADVTAPAAKDAADLVYTSRPLPLVEAGAVTGGTMEYSLDGLAWSVSIPTGTDAGEYTVHYRVKGDSNHNDWAPTAPNDSVTVTITPQVVSKLTIEFTPNSASYNGTVQKPQVTVKDNNGIVIPEGCYEVTYVEDNGENWKDVGDYTVRITGKNGGNYSITATGADAEATFTIRSKEQGSLSIVNKPSGRILYGDTFYLSTSGGNGQGTVTWSSNDENVAAVGRENGRVQVLKAGEPVTITARLEVDGYDPVSAEWTFNADRRPILATIIAKDKAYDGNNSAEFDVVFNSSDIVSGDVFTAEATGRFQDEKVGTNKKVFIDSVVTAPDVSEKYDFIYPATTTASITPGILSVTDAPQAIPNLTYDGSPKTLVTPGSVSAGGHMEYSLDGAVFTQNIPAGTDAKTYNVWYKAVADNANYANTPAAVLPVTIAPKTVTAPDITLTPDTFEYDGTPKKPDVFVRDGGRVIPAGEYTVSYSNNVNAGQATVTISDNPGGNYTVSGSATFTIKAAEVSLKEAPKAINRVYDGFEEDLVTPGVAVNGRMMYKVDGDSAGYGTTIPRKTNAGTYKVWYKVVDSENKDVPNTEDSVTVTIQKKPVTPTILLEGQTSYSTPYTGSPVTPNVTVRAEGGSITDFTATYFDNDRIGTAGVIVENGQNSNYRFNEVRTFTITKAKATFFAGPLPKEDLIYTGEPQELLFDGGCPDQPDDGIVVYSTDSISYSPDIPTGIKAGRYVVSAKVLGNENYEDSAVKRVMVTIGKNVVERPTVILSENENVFKYTGKAHTPTVTVYDADNLVIPATEYTVSYTNNVEPGTATVTVRHKGTNCSFTNPGTVTFTIVDDSQTPLEIVGKPETVCYGDTLKLSTRGGAGTGNVTWTVTGPLTGTAGQYTVAGSGPVTITATEDSGAVATWDFIAQPRPVTAVVTATEKTYDGNTDAGELTVSYGALVGTDDLSSSVKVEGTFQGAGVGENKTITLVWTIPPEVAAKYAINYPSTVTGSITRADASVSPEPQKAGSLTYDGSPQKLVNIADVTVTGGKLAYSLDGNNYSYNIPEGTDAGTYEVWYKVIGDENHKDSDSKPVEAKIAQNTDRPEVECVPGSFDYDGTEKTPTVVVKDRVTGKVLPESEYTVTMDPNRIKIGTYNVTVTDKPGVGNYEFGTADPKTFEIKKASQERPIIIADQYDVCYGDRFRLRVENDSAARKVRWSSSDTNIATVDEFGVVTVTGIGGFKISACWVDETGAEASGSYEVPFNANPKPVTPIIKASDKAYDGKTDAALTASWKTGDLVNAGDITIVPGSLKGEFDTPDVGTGKQVNIVQYEVTGKTDLYDISWPAVTASVTQVDAQVNPTLKPSAKTLVYTGNEQDLINPGETVGRIAEIVYSLNRDGEYSKAVPKAVAAGTYTVWYMVADTVNYKGFGPISIEVVIAEAPPSTGGGTGDPGDIPDGPAPAPGPEDPGETPDEPEQPEDPGETPDEPEQPEETPEPPAAERPGSSSGSGSSGSYGSSSSSGTTQTTVRGETASVRVGSDVVKEAVANNSSRIVIKPEISGDVTRTEVAIPAATVGQIKRDTSADLTVSAPAADVTIPHAVLETLSGDVKVVTEQADQAISVTLTAGGRTVESVPGGLTLTIPAENAGPGTVAVLLHEDGTRETLRRSIAADGKVTVPLNGSATVEIVDNSREFADVPSGNWAADAVAFASAHELFSGTSVTTFSPDQVMSRGMLASVLYRLEGSPEQDGAATFGDVGSDAWYADGVAWATENGIANGYGNGQFGPDDSITREQFVVMLWKYAGSPQAGSQTLGFTDAAQVSGYAKEALCWAVECGILSGYDGQLAPGGTATRAQAAQMLKNFMENT